jgi:hypothetical protein
MSFAIHRRLHHESRESGANRAQQIRVAMDSGTAGQISCRCCRLSSYYPSFSSANAGEKIRKCNAGSKTEFDPAISVSELSAVAVESYYIT